MARSYLSVAPTVCNSSCAMTILFCAACSSDAKALTTPISPFCKPEGVRHAGNPRRVVVEDEHLDMRLGAVELRLHPCPETHLQAPEANLQRVATERRWRRQSMDLRSERDIHWFGLSQAIALALRAHELRNGSETSR